MRYIDYTQYRAFQRCRWYWYEKFVRGYQKKREGQRADALCLGALVHAGLENWARAQSPTIPEAAVTEQLPTPECLAQAQSLVLDYTRSYPNEEWAIHRLEEPLMFPLLDADKSLYVSVGVAPEELLGLAKIDAYFYNPELRTLESGLPGVTLSLEPGWWIREYKTKDASKNRANWMKNWEVNMQASFQMLALEHHLGVTEPDNTEPVRGVLVSVLEKERPYVPKRKCAGCGEMLPMSAYLPSEGGNHACPLCGEEQHLKPYESKAKNTAAFYRLKVLRTHEQLIRDLNIITDTLSTMEEMRLYGKLAVAPNFEECVDDWYGPCEFFNVHINNTDLATEQTLEHTDTNRYTGITMAPTVPLLPLPTSVPTHVVVPMPPPLSDDADDEIAEVEVPMPTIHRASIDPPALGEPESRRCSTSLPVVFTPEDYADVEGWE